MKLELRNVKRVHCIGIGGIGVSAIARMLRLGGVRVTGSDVSRSPMTATLRKLGIRVFFGHRAANVPKDADLVVYTKAVSRDNPELRAAKRRGIPCLSYAETLGVISREKYTIAVSGAHGKTTTTAMIGHVLRKAGLDPTIIVGGVMNDAGTNFVAGRGKYLVVEACEYKKSFLDIHPRVIVITNIDNDHLDYYKNITNIKRAFAAFAAKLGKDDFLVCDPNDPNMKVVVLKARCHVVNYRRIPLRVPLKIFGEHHRRNAQAALAVARILGVPMKTAERALGTFRGVKRRFEYKGTWRACLDSLARRARRARLPCSRSRVGQGVRFYDDYAHHPTEIKATLRAAREHLGRRTRIWCVFQPHLYSRTRLLVKDFARSFGDANGVLLADIYAAREKDDGKTNSRILAERINKNTPALYFGMFPRIAAFLQEHARRGDVVITMGAGEAYKVWELVRKR